MSLLYSGSDRKRTKVFIISLQDQTNGCREQSECRARDASRSEDLKDLVGSAEVLAGVI